MQIAPVLRIGRGVTALIGSGGKTTLLYTLTEELRRRGSVILCASAKIRVPEQYALYTGAEPQELSEALRERGAVCVGTPCGNGKLTAPSLSFDTLARLADYVLVEADGSRGLPMKAHAAHEPVVPANAQRTVLVIGADGFGKPIREVCHRPALYASLAGVSEDDPVTPELAARVLAAEALGDRIYINKTEKPEDLEAAQQLAQRLTCPVIAGSLHKGVYLCLQ